MSGRRRLGPAVVWVVALTVALAVSALHLVVRPQLADDPLVGSGRVDAPEIADAPAAVLAALPDPAGRADAATLASRLEALPRDGVGDVVGLVSDATTGTELYRTGAGPRTPASSMKVLSALVAVDVLGPEHRFETSTWLGADGLLVLRGGGDPLLASDRPTGYPRAASLQELATATAGALRDRQVTSVRLGFDATRFGGPAWSPHWPDIFARSVAPITALTADHARPSLAEDAWARDPDPAAFAAGRFAAHLRAAGVNVTEVVAAVTPDGATELASVPSLPVRVIAERALATSDNDASETLLWQVALARGRPATPESAAAVLTEELRARGLWSEGMVIHDGNGIAATNLVTPDALVGAVRAGLEEPRLRAVATGLPVAGVSGTLSERFENADSVAGRGLVRAKTGTIRGVNSLTGYVVTADGQPLVFAFLVSGGAGQTSARAWLDRVTASLASCGCSG